MALRTWMKQHPIAAYVGLAMVWSWSIWSFLFLVIKPGGLVHNPPPISFIFVVVGGIGPSLSSLVVTRVVYGREGVRALWARLRNGRVGRWWLAILIIPAATAVTPLLRWAAGYTVDGRAMLGLIGPGLGLGLVAGLMEEIGWRGFLLPHLLKRYAPLPATLLTGAIWGGLWHGYADYFGLGDKGPAFWPIMLMLGPVLLTAWSLILTWVYERTNGSLLLSVLMHASISSSALILGQSYTTLGEEMAWTAVSVGVALVVGLSIWFGLRRGPAPIAARPARPRARAMS